VALTITSRGTGTHNTGATTLVPGGRSATLAVGSLGVLCIALDNEGSAGSTLIAPDSWTDAKGNIWTLRQNALYDNGAASAGIEMAIYTARINVALLTTDAGTMTWKTGVSPVAKAWTWYEVIPSAGHTPLYVSGGTIAGATAANAQVTTASVPVGDGVIAGYFSENTAAVTGDSDTTNGTWAAQQTATIGTTTAGVRIATQQKVQTTTPSTQSYDVTVTSQDRIAGYILVTDALNTTGDVALTSPAGALAATAAETFSATAAVTSPAGALAATGAETFSATAAIASPTGVLAGTGVETFSGTAAITSPAGSLGGAGATFGGTVAITSPAGALASTAAETFAATVAEASPAGSLAATAAETFSGTAAEASPTGSLAATGAQAFAATVAITSPTGSLALTGTYTPQAITGSLVPASPAGSLAATGGLEFAGSLAEAGPAGAPALAGTYTPLAIAGDAAVTSPPGELAASAAEEFAAGLAIESPAGSLELTGVYTPPGAIVGAAAITSPRGAVALTATVTGGLRVRRRRSGRVILDPTKVFAFPPPNSPAIAGRAALSSPLGSLSAAGMMNDDELVLALLFP